MVGMGVAGEGRDADAVRCERLRGGRGEGVGKRDAATSGAEQGGQEGEEQRSDVLGHAGAGSAWAWAQFCLGLRGGVHIGNIGMENC